MTKIKTPDEATLEFQKSMQLYSKSVIELTSPITEMQKSISSIMLKPNPFTSIQDSIRQIVEQQKLFQSRFNLIRKDFIPASHLYELDEVSKKLIPKLTNAFASIPSITKSIEPFKVELQELLSGSVNYYNNVEDISDYTIHLKEDIKEITSVFQNISTSNEVTKKDIDSINERLQKSDNSAFIYFLISLLITIAFQLYSTQSNVSTTNNISININEKKEIEDGFNEMLSILSFEKRTAKNDVHLRTRPDRNSGIIGVVNKGQIVIVQSIKHKWIYVAYTGEDMTLKSGWVYKKYFGKIR